MNIIMALGLDFENRVEIDAELTDILEVGPMKSGDVLMEFHRELVAVNHDLHNYLAMMITALAEGYLMSVRVNIKTEAFQKWISKPQNASIECCILSENVEEVSEEVHYRYLPIFAVIDEKHCSAIWCHPIIRGGATQFGTQLTNLVEWYSIEAVIEMKRRWNLKQWKDVETQTEPCEDKELAISSSDQE